MKIKTCIVLLVSLLASFVMVSGCSAFAKKLSSEDAASMQGKGLSVVVLAPSELNSSLGGAWLFGALGQALKGNALQARLHLQDPAIAVKPELEKFFSTRFNMAPGTDYQLTLQTTYWGIGHRILSKDDYLLVAAIVAMQLTSGSGKVLARVSFDGIPDLPQFAIPPDRLTEDNGRLPQQAFDNIAHKAALRFIEWLSI